MKSKNSFLLMTQIIGIVITALFVYAVAIDLIREHRADSEHFFSYLTNMFIRFDSYKNPPGLYLIYLVGYAIAWWKSLWDSIIIITVSIIGYIFSEYSDVRFSYLLLFLVGFLYLVYWNEKRRRKTIPNGEHP